jgi:hypothetical protein
MLSVLSVLGYYLNVQINSMKSNQDTTEININIMNTYLSEISPWILLGDENQQSIIYPGI